MNEDEIFIYNPLVNYSDKEHIKKEVLRLCRLIRYLGGSYGSVPYDEVAEGMLESIQVLSRLYINLSRKEEKRDEET